MKKLSTLAVFSLLLFGCADKAFPPFPDIKDDYFVAIEKGKPVCIKFKIVSTLPYKIATPEFLPIESCEGVGGYLPKDRVTFLNWTDDVQRWGTDHLKCVK